MPQVALPRQFPLEELHVAGRGVFELEAVERREPDQPRDRFTAAQDASFLQVSAQAPYAAVQLRERTLPRVRNPIELPITVLVFDALGALRLDDNDAAS